MTIPYERTRAVLNAQKFLMDLSDPRATKRVPKAIRERAYRILRHFPGSFSLKLSAQHMPDMWGQP